MSFWKSVDCVVSKSVVSTMYYSEYSIFISWQRIRIFIPDIPLAGWCLSSMAGRVVMWLNLIMWLLLQTIITLLILQYYGSAGARPLTWSGWEQGHSVLAVVKTNIWSPIIVSGHYSVSSVQYEIPGLPLRSLFREKVAIGTFLQNQVLKGSLICVKSPYFTNFH